MGIALQSPADSLCTIATLSECPAEARILKNVLVDALQAGFGQLPLQVIDLTMKAEDERRVDIGEVIAERPDIIALDLPKKAPLELIRRLVFACPEATVIAIAPDFPDRLRLGVLEAGAAHLLLKPIQGKAIAEMAVPILAATQRRLAAAERPPHADIPFGARPDLAFDSRPEAAAVFPILPLWRQEQRIIESTLAVFDGHVAKAAAALEISPSTIYRKMQSWHSKDAVGS